MQRAPARHRWRDSKQNAKHVDLPEEGLRTRVQFPPAPPSTKTKAAKEHHLAAFFIGKSGTYAAGTDKGNH
jgi:hypothetical protein